MTDTVDEAGCLHIDPSKPKALLRQLGGMKAKEYELLLEAGITPDGDSVRFSFGLGWIMLRRREPSLSWADAQDRVVADFDLAGIADDDEEAAVGVDPTAATS